MKKYGTLLVDVYGVDEKHEMMAIITAIIPMARELICSIVLTLMNTRQFTTLFFSWTTLIYLAFMLEKRRLNSGNHKIRFELLIELYLI
jgi:hypothetical protein